MTTEVPQPIATLTDLQLTDELRDQVNRARQNNDWDRDRMRAILDECRVCGWNFGNHTPRRLRQ